MLACELPNDGIDVMVVSPMRTPPANGSPSKNWINTLSASMVPVFLIFTEMVIVSPAVGVGFEKEMSVEEMERFGFTLANALKASAVEYGSSFHEPLGS